MNEFSQHTNISMRLLHVIPSLSPIRGGPSFAVPVMARGLARAGLEVHIATTDDNGAGHLDVPLEQPLLQDGVTFWYFRRQTQFYTASWPITRWLARHVRHYDLLHIHCLFSYASVAAAFFAIRCGVPYIVRPLGTLMRWGMEQRRPSLKRLSFALIERHILRRAALVHYTSEQERREAAQLGLDTPSLVIPLGLDPSSFVSLLAGEFRRQRPELAERTLLLFMSRLDPKKGLDLLLPAFARVCQQHFDVALVLAGSGQDAFKAQLRAEAIRLGLERNLVWAGFLSGDAKLAALADADVFVLSSYSENFGVAVVEAMARGLPVIISDQVGIHHEVAGAGAGLVVPCQVEALAQAIVQLAGDADLRRRLGANGRRLARERFSLEVVTTRLMQVYREVTHLC